MRSRLAFADWQRGQLVNLETDRFQRGNNRLTRQGSSARPTALRKLGRFILQNDDGIRLI